MPFTVEDAREIGKRGGRPKRGGPVLVPLWKIAEMAGCSESTVKRAIRRGELTREVESVFGWLRAKQSAETR